MSYEIKAEIDGKEYTFESDVPNPSEKDIMDAIGGYHQSSADLHQQAAPSNSLVDVAKQAAGAALDTFGAAPRQSLMAPVAEPIQPTSGNPVMGALQAAGQTLQNPLRVSPTLSQPGQIAGQKAEDAIGPNHPILGKLANIATSAALDPQSYALGPAAEGLGKVADQAAGVVGEKVLAPAGELASATKIRDIKRLFENPLEVLTADGKKAGAAMGDLEKNVFNVTEDETRLIAKAGDRTPGTARTVVEGLIQEGKDRAAAAGKDTANWATELTPGELLAARRAASKMSTTAQGRDSYINYKDLKSIEDAFVAKGQEKAMEYLQAVRQSSMAKTRQAFLSLFPRNQNMSTNALRGVGMVALGHVNPAAALAMSPITTGAATLAAKAAYGIGKAVGRPVAQAGIPTGLAAIRSFLSNKGR
jgi:hypothetical protein